jgi:glycine/D-amino acid oxidase-like deaminating enzyme
MREVALRRGVRIFEKTNVKHFSRSRPVTLTTTNGSVLAETLVLATNAWAARVPELARSIVVVSSDIIASQPIPERLKRENWSSGPGVNDSRQMVNYIRTTFDGRILSGKGGLASGFGGHIGDGLFHSKKRAAVVRQNFDALYPDYGDVETPISWSGPVDRSADGLPLLGALPNHDNILFGIGWSGNGLGPSRMGGRILASLALGETNEWTTLPIVGRPKQDLPPEPFRYVGSHLVRAAVGMKDNAEANNNVPNRLVEAIANLAPRGVEDQ